MFEFTLTCIGSKALEANLKLTPWERMEKHDKLLNEWLEFEVFMEKLYRGLNFIKS